MNYQKYFFRDVVVFIGFVSVVVLFVFLNYLKQPLGSKATVVVPDNPQFAELNGGEMKRISGYIKKVYEKEGRKYLKLELAKIESCSDCPSGIYMTDINRQEDLEVSDDVEVNALSFNDPNVPNSSIRRINYAELKSIFDSDRDPAWSYGGVVRSPWKMIIDKDGKVSIMDQVYLP
jgi:hypothetical protein